MKKLKGRKFTRLSVGLFFILFYLVTLNSEPVDWVLHVTQDYGFNK